MKLKTLDYGLLPIAYKRTWLCDDTLNYVEDNQGNYYEIKQTLDGVVVALLSN